MKKINKLETIKPFTIFGFLTLLFLISCGFPGSFTTSPTNTPREQWVTDWLDNPTCQPPCWENITVANTTIPELVSKLSNTDDIVLTGPYKNDISKQTTVYWEFPDNKSGGQAITGYNNSIIILMNLSVNQNQNLRISEVIKVYGDPNYVLVRECNSGFLSLLCTVHLIFNKGLALELLLSSNHDKVDISEDSTVGRIWFFPPGIQGYESVLSKTLLNIQASVIKWEGYKEYTYSQLQ